MKNTSTVIKLLFFAVACSCLLAGHAYAANNNQSGTITIQRDPGGHEIRTTIDKSGGFSFRGLKAGKYTLSVTAPEPAKNVNTGICNRKKISSRIMNGPEGVKVVVTFCPRDSGRTTVKIALPKGGMISGTVLFSDPGVKKDVNNIIGNIGSARLNKGRNPHTPSPQPHNTNNPIPGYDIVILKQPNGNAIKATTDNKGGFTFRGLKAGDYTLTVKIPAKLDRDDAWYVGLEGGAMVKVSPEPIKFTVAKDGQMITGTLVSSSGPGVKKDVNSTLSSIGSARLHTGRNPHTPSPQPHDENNPIPGIDVVVRKQPGGSAIKATTDNKGGFTFRELKAGDYTLNVIVPAKMDMQGWYIGLGIGYNNIPLGKGSSQPIKFTVAKDGQAITGTLFSSSGPGVKKDVNNTIGSARVNKGKNTHHSARR